MIQYEPLENLSISNDAVKIIQSSLPELIHLEDPASSAMWDFTELRPQIAAPDLNCADAVAELRLTGSHYLFIIEPNTNQLKGIITSKDLLGEKPIQWLQETRRTREELLVKFLMTPIAQVIKLNKNIIATAKVGNIVESLQRAGAQYALIIDDNANSKSITLHGLFSLASIKKMLHDELKDS